MPDPHQLMLDLDWPEGDPAATTSVLPATNRPDEVIPYSIKVSARARQVYLRAVPGRGLVVTIPKRFPRREIPSIVENQREWVEQALADLDAQVPEEYRQWPPLSLTLEACDSKISISYTEPTSSTISARWLDSHQLLVEADRHDRVAVASCIAGALKLRAKQMLAPWLSKLALQHGFDYKRLVVRGQRSVWGSYSSSGTLSLNYKLLFLNQRLVHYVLLHELTHTRHLDHSAAFWKLLEQQMPGARSVDKELGDAANLVPPWLELAV